MSYTVWELDWAQAEKEANKTPLAHHLLTCCQRGPLSDPIIEAILAGLNLRRYPDVDLEDGVLYGSGSVLNPYKKMGYGHGCNRNWVVLCGGTSPGRMEGAINRPFSLQEFHFS